MANTSTSLTIKNNYVQPMDNNHHDKLSKKNDDFVDLENQDCENSHYTKEMLLQALSPTLRQYFKMVLLLENPKSCKRVLYTLIAVTCSVIMGAYTLVQFTYIPGTKITSGNSTQHTEGVVTMDPISLEDAAYGNGFAIAIPIQIWFLLIYFDDNGKDFYENIWKPLAKKEKDNTSKVTYKMHMMVRVVCVITLFLFLIPSMISIAINEAGAPLWYVIYLEIVCVAFAITFFFGAVAYLVIICFVVVAISSAGKYQIQNISNLVVTRIKNYDINKDGETKILDELENEFDIAKDKIIKSVERMGTALAWLIFTFILSPIFLCADMVLSVIAGTPKSFALLFVASLHILLNIYGLALILRVTILPSIQYELFVDKLQKPKNLWVISKCYSGNQATLHYFFSGLERQSKNLIWKSMGVPITFGIYQKVIGSLVSILIMSMAFMLRGAMTGS